MPFAIASKHEILWDTSDKMYVRLYIENYKMLYRDIKEEGKKGKIFYVLYFLGLEDSILLMSILPQLINRFKAISIRTPAGF